MRCGISIARRRFPGSAIDLITLARAMDERLARLDRGTLAQAMRACGCKFRDARARDDTIARLFPEVFGSGIK
jgi:hypothetical protein